MTVSVMNTSWVRLGSLEVRRDLNHRKHVNQDRIDQYARMLDNGENPPPVQVDYATNIVVDGNHRFFAAKMFHQARSPKWQDCLIEVQWVSDAPDPYEDPVHYLLMTAIKNRHNGEPLDPKDVHQLLIQTIKAHGKEEAKKYAPLLNESPETVDRLYRMITPANPEVLERRPETGHFTQTAVDQATIRRIVNANAVAVQDSSMPLRSIHISGTRSYRPPIMSACRALLNHIKQAKGDFTDAERSELAHVRQVISQFLG